MSEIHGTVVRFQPAWAEWLAKCSCGWTGSYSPSEAAAMREADEHRDAADD